MKEPRPVAAKIMAGSNKWDIMMAWYKPQGYPAAHKVTFRVQGIPDVATVELTVTDLHDTVPPSETVSFDGRVASGRLEGNEYTAVFNTVEHTGSIHIEVYYEKEG